jgi:hypothetical protein
MPSDDLVLSVRQIAGYPATGNAVSSDAIVLQRGGLGGPYLSIDPVDFVGTALANGGNLAVGGQVLAGSIQAGSAQFSNGAFGLLNAQTACIDNLNATWGSIDTLTSAAATFVSAAAGTLSVTGDMQVGGTANLANAAVQGNLTANYATVLQTLDATNLNVSNLATVCNLIVNGNLAIPNGTATIGGYPIVTTGNLGLSGLAPLDSPPFIGTPTAPTPPLNDASAALATTAFVAGAVNHLAFAPLASPNFSGVPSAPTANVGTSTAQLATTAFVQAAIAGSTAGVSSFNSRTGAVVLTAADVTSVGGALLASPSFTGTPQAPTAGPGVSTTQLATTAFVQAAVQAVNVGVTTFNTRAGAVSLTTADITAVGGALAVNAGVPSFNGRSGAITLTANDVTAAGALANPSPGLTGVPTAPTAAPGVSTTQLATTAFVMAAVGGFNAGVTTFNGRGGAVTLTAADITGAGGALLASPAFTGVPTAPTAPANTSTTQLATCAFVTAAIAAGVAGVSSFNSRTGAVVLTSNDISAAGGALASQAGVSSFNTRTGAIIFTAADLSGVGGALLAGPAFTGVPTAPTATANSSTTQLATTAFVTGALASYLPLTGGTLSGAFAVGGNGIGYTLLGGANVAWGYGSTSSGGGQQLSVAVNGLSQGTVPFTNGGLTGIIQWGINAGGGSATIYSTATLGYTFTISASDRRLKRNIEPAGDALGVVNALKVYACDMTIPGETPQHWDCALIADEVEVLIPRGYIAPPPPMARGSAETYAGIDTLPIVATLVRAVQQLTTRLTQLETRIAT